MGIGIKSSSEPNDSAGAVFGTFGLQYNTREYERIRDDGYNTIGMVPDCRVFVCGGEITKDVRDVQVTNSIDGNKCQITLMNPRGRYEITKQDLMGKWREDKDILATYEYADYNRVAPRLFENFMDKIAESTIGEKKVANIKRGLNIAKSAGKLLGNATGVPSVRGVTRQMFEVKHFSGLTKKSGDVVFDFKDPVYVFFKGRFAPLWYFGFSGIVTGWDDADVYGQSQTINLKCEDITSLWKRSKLTTQGAMFPFSRMEDRVKSNQTGVAFQIRDLQAAFTFSNLIKIAVYSYDKGLSAYNCHASRPGRYYSEGDDIKFHGIKGEKNLANNTVYKDAKGDLHQKALIDAGVYTVGGDDGRYMFTRHNPSWDSPSLDGTGKLSWTSSTFGDGGRSNLYGKNLESNKKTGQINIKDINYIFPELSLGKDEYNLNGSPVGPSLSVYTQFNEIEFPAGVKFTGKNLKSFLDISVRYWEAGHRMPEKELGLAEHTLGTGWIDNKAFGIAGPHPALTWEFVNNFHILGNIWEQCYVNKTNLDKVIMSPHDKIRASVAGSPTELVPQDKMVTSRDDPVGTCFNFFRPRLYLVLPRRFSDRYKKADGGFKTLDNLFKESNTTIYDFVKERLKGVEYILYTSPVGDIYLEPELYDFHPLDFSEKIEDRDIKIKEMPIKLKTMSGAEVVTGDRADKAYFFDPQANHPFFIMEKDRTRVTQTFDHKNIHTSIVVKGGQTPQGGITDVLDDKTMSMITSLNMARQFRGHTIESNLIYGVYVADGFQKSASPNKEIGTLKRKRDELSAFFKKMVYYELYASVPNMKIYDLLSDYIAKMSVVDKSHTFFVLFEEKAKKLNDLLVTEGDTARIELTVAKNLFPELYDDVYRTVSQVLSKKIKNKKTLSQQDADDVKATSVLKDLLQASTPGFRTSLKAIDGTDLLSSKGKSNKYVLKLIELYEIAVVTGAGKSDIAILAAEKLKSVIEDYESKTVSLVRTIYDMKKAATKKLYDPRLDMVRHYGYNPKEPIKNPFIKSGEEAYEYARAVFNRLKGRAFQINMGVIGRPEFMLNRPYYCERKDAIGLLHNFSVKYSHGAEFSSSAKLFYVRKNAITYKYSEGSLDPFSSETTTNNAYFKKQADTYYKTNKIFAGLSNKIVNKVTDTIKGSSTPGFGRGLAAKTVGGLTGNLLGMLMPAGGIFTAHDRIGHIPFDTRFGEDYTKGSTATPSGADPKNDEFGYAGYAEELFNLADEITEVINHRELLKKSISVSYNELDAATTTRNNQAEEFEEKHEAMSAEGVTQSRKTRLIKELMVLEKKLRKTQGNRSAIIATIDKKNEYLEDEVNAKLYGTLDKPSNLNADIHNTYNTLVFSGEDISRHIADKISNGLFYKLFVKHVLARRKDFAFTDWEIFEDNPPDRDFIELGKVPYYIKYVF